jgi:hypothetical protein
MNSIVKRSVAVGMLLAVVAVKADVIVEDFSSGTTANILPEGGEWIADGDEGLQGTPGTSTVRALDGGDLVKGNLYSGDNTATAYADDATITSKLYVKADVSADKKWAYAGWVMDFNKPHPQDTTKHVYELNLWERYQEVDVSTCDKFEISMQFDAGRVIWIELYSPQAERMNPNTVPNGWHKTGTGNMETYDLPLRGVPGPQPKWTDPANKATLNLASISRLKILYEGFATGSATPSYDTVGHLMKIKKVAFLGGTCQVKPNYGSSLSSGVREQKLAKSNVSFAALNGQLRFNGLANAGDLKVTVSDMSGKVVTQGAVNALRNTVDVSQLRTGLYTVQAVGSALKVSNTITLLK